MISCHLTASAAGTTWCAILRCFPLLEFIKLSLPSILQEIYLIELPTFFFFFPLDNYPAFMVDTLDSSAFTLKEFLI